MSPKLRIILLNLFLFLCSFAAIGQDKGGPPPPNRTIDPPVGLVVPIDDAIIYLFIAGLLLGIYFYVKSTCKKVA